MFWFHKSDPNWLASRKNYLTASDVVKLLPTTATGRKRSGLDEVMFKIWAAKQCGVTDDDIESTGVMARGHILEKYAIRAFNKRYPHGYQFHHWDDTLIYSGDGFSMSPDGLDIFQPEGCPVALGDCDARAVIEVKSYNAAAHYELGMTTDPMLVPERWQIAAAMYVMPTITYGVLAFFNPSAAHPLFTQEYDRALLKSELEMIEEIVAAYWAKVDDFEDVADTMCDVTTVGCCMLESEIIDIVLEEVNSSSLNP
jgi:hypothetical protein